MNILILSPFLPYPLDQGGKIRIFNIIKNLARSHSVTLAAIVDHSDTVGATPLRELCDEVILVERPARLWPDRVAFFSGSLPYNVIRYRSPELRRALRQLGMRKQFDLVQIEFPMMWQYRELFPNTPASLDAHNIEYRNVQQIGSVARGLFWKAMYRLEERRLRKVEELAWRESAICFAVSEAERDEIAACTGQSRSVVTAANGVDPERFAFLPRKKGEQKILFLGGMDYAPNLDAARYFLGEIFPLIRRQEPKATVLLVGRDLEKLGDAADQPGVVRHENVPEVLPFFYEADVLAVPLRQGAGTRVKVLEAMAAGLPVVSTSKGCEGIDVVNGREMTIADSPEAFSEGVLQVMAQPDLARVMAERAHALAMARYTWQNAAAIMNEQISRL